eukprot:scaffold563_cov410-Prasinococcus_capsulatus_cf.AAC.19
MAPFREGFGAQRRPNEAPLARPPPFPAWAPTTTGRRLARPVGVRASSTQASSSSRSPGCPWAAGKCGPRPPRGACPVAPQ